MVLDSVSIESPLGTLVVTWEAERLRGLELANFMNLYPGRGLEPCRAQVLALVKVPDKSLSEGLQAGKSVPTWVRQAIDDYFLDGAFGLDLPIAPAGTDFQGRVWQALRAIPPGSTRTYGELARDLGTSARAIGGACRANPCLIAVPCHRVVARDGLGGFAGERGGKRLAVKRWLLRHEGAAAGRLP